MALTIFAKPSFAESVKDPLPVRVQALLPAPIQSFQIHQTKLNSVENALGKADLIENGVYYWAFQGMKYSLALTFSKDVLDTLNFHYVEKNPTLKNFNGLVKKTELKAAYQPNRPSEVGAMLFSKNGIKLEFDPRDMKLESVDIR